MTAVKAVKAVPKMGEMAKDTITGFVGMVTGRSVYINGCVHLMLEAKAKAGMKPVHAWFDEARCVVAKTRSGAVAKRKTIVPRRKGPGGPMPHSR